MCTDVDVIRIAMSNAEPPLARILIVDDEAPLMQALCDILSEHGYDTTGFTSSTQALTAITSSKFDLLLSDLIMPGMDGIALLREALKIDSDLVGIIITGAGTIETAVEAMQVGAFDYIQKPLKLSVILPVLNRALTMRRLRMENLELQQRVRERTAQLEFFSVVSHELRTPLNAINGWSHLLQTAALTPDQMAHGWDVMQRSVKAQTQIIDDLLDVSRLITGKLKLRTRTVSVDAVIDAVVESVEPAAGAKNIELKLSIDRSADPVAADADRLRQVLWNLLFNAIKFTPADGRVDVRLEQTAGGTIEVTVSDTGQGIRAEFLPYVFDPFRQQDASSTRRHGGLGLGLSIVRQLVELHGGTVSVSSEGEGKGASFTVKLPVSPFSSQSVDRPANAS